MRRVQWISVPAFLDLGGNRIGQREKKHAYGGTQGDDDSSGNGSAF